jgi:hypothetical protein
MTPLTDPAMKRGDDFIIWSCLLVAGAWSALFLAVIVGGSLLFAADRVLGVPGIRTVASSVGYYGTWGSPIAALGAAIIGVPVLAGRRHLGFWRGLLGVAVALSWLVLPPLLLFAWVGNGLPTALALAGLNLLAALSCAVILIRRRRGQAP